MGVCEIELRRRIYCHRGLWATKSDRNSSDALRRASLNGFGIETDIRDSAGNLVIFHDAYQSSGQLLSMFFDLNTPLTLNLKSDGLLQGIGIQEIPRVAQITRALGIR